ncbi:MAG TPA: tRNA glutamyl-Q(34) synthetase GluQRS [Ktedonobacterales bacterium]
MATPSRGRYAPSPSGVLHLGNLRTALLAWLFARKAGGGFILRMEDLDVPRSRPGAAAGIVADLRWLGLDWDEGPDIGGLLGPYTQSARQSIYEAALARLRARGLLYPCYCTRAELAKIASAPHGPDGAPYPGTCSALTTRERFTFEAAGRRPAWRFRVPQTPVRFHDMLMGEVVESLPATSGDFIVMRSDGIVSYHLAVVVDDALMRVTQIVRGADLLGSVARQLALYDALDLPRPREYAHVPLMADAGGARLAKRTSAAGLGALRAHGATPTEVVRDLASSCGLWGTSSPVSTRDLLAVVELTKLRTG